MYKYRRPIFSSPFDRGNTVLIVSNSPSTVVSSDEQLPLLNYSTTLASDRFVCGCLWVQERCTVFSADKLLSPIEQ
jgi:hypothetical protein